VADAAIVASQDVLLADAAATALGNRIVSKEAGHIEAVLSRFQPVGVDGMMVVAGDMVGIRGDLPELCRADVEYDLITCG
jgi:ApbE superfamily uncharacterized protein (UPF0280 family)